MKITREVFQCNIVSRVVLLQCTEYNFSLLVSLKMSKTLGLRQNDHTPSLLAGLKVCVRLELAFWDPDPLSFGSHGSGFVIFLGPSYADPFICSSCSAHSLSLIVIVTDYR